MNNNIIKKNEGIINNSELLNPKNIKFLKEITKDSYSDYILDNTFCAFNSINDDMLYLIYSNKKRSIITYNLIDNKKINEIKNAHEMLITNFRHYLDKINLIDLILSISANDNNIKLWNFENFNCLVNIKNINENGILLSACFLNDNNHILILTSQYRKYLGNISEFIKVFDLNGNKIKEINNSDDRTCFIDNYYDVKLFKNFIITGNYDYVKSYDYNKNKILHKYWDKDKQNHYSATIINNNIQIELIESSEDGNIRIWDFYSGNLLKKLKFGNYFLCGICLWNKEYLFVGCEDKTIELIDINKGIIINNLIRHHNNVVTIKKVFHHKYGDCLISQGYANDQIKFWIYNK